MNIRLTNALGMLKEAKIGFSWTMLFFGVFVPLIRMDWLHFLISLVLAFITSGLSWFVYPFFYNRLYINNLLKNGWLPATDLDRDALVEHNFIISQQ